MHDIVIRGGTLFDGTGRPGFIGDLAIDGDRIVQVGGQAGPGRREIDAEGALVTPGWVDAHTHYDAQATWDPMLAPSSWHGVTTVLFGNCGVGFAPVREGDRQALIDLMEGVEEIPGITLTEGMTWDWETFPQFLDVLEAMPRAINIAAQVTHHPLRVYVMGERALRHEPASAQDIAEMRRLALEALRAGAYGFTTSRTNNHKTLAGVMPPGRYAETEELTAIGSALGEAGHGAFGMLNDFEDEAAEFDWITRMTKASGRPAWFLLGQQSTDPERHRRLIAGLHAARAEGGLVSCQVPGRLVGVLMGVDTEFNPFSVRPAYAPLLALPPQERLERMRDPQVRAAILADVPSAELMQRFSPLRQTMVKTWNRVFVLGNPPNYEPPPTDSIAAIAAREGRTPDEAAYDYLTEGLDRLLVYPVLNYVDANLDATRELLIDEGSLFGLSDAGAHCSSVVDGGIQSYMLTHWARDRTRGEKLPLEQVVKMQTQDTASFFGFHDRGVLAPGMMADVNVIDHDALTIHAPEVIYDLPAGGRRLVQKVDGYIATLVAGRCVFENGQHTGALPGKLLRAGR